jgi:hypothetical protein
MAATTIPVPVRNIALSISVRFGGLNVQFPNGSITDTKPTATKRTKTGIKPTIMYFVLKKDVVSVLQNYTEMALQ